MTAQSGHRESEARGGGLDLLILIPVYNDWKALTLLLGELDRTLGEAAVQGRVLLVDDGSTEPIPDSLREISLNALPSVSVLSLRRNLGHQRALAIAMAHIEEREPCDTVLVMDGDGEDSPADIPRLIEKLRETGGRKIIFAERARRSERWIFQAGYRAYRILHLVLTGLPVRVGNFSIVPRHLLRRLVVVSELWNHYAAAVFKSHLPFATVHTERAKRLAGRSTMSVVSLTVHGLSALSVHGELAGVRLLIAAVIAIGLLAVAVLSIAVVPFVARVEVPGWAPAVAGVALVLLLQVVLLAVAFIFIILQGRAQAGFIPARDYSYFVDKVEVIAGRAARALTSRRP